MFNDLINVVKDAISKRLIGYTITIADNHSTIIALRIKKIK